MDDLGYGVRLATYGFSDDELTAAVDGLLADDALRSGLDALGERIRDANGTHRAADLIEDIGRRHQPQLTTPKTSE
jgi:UDP:flavonoid glycosyltransferase YjiC (YdhE family)